MSSPDEWGMISGPMLARRRQLYRLTGAAVAERLGVSRQRIAAIENCVSLRPETARKVVDAIEALRAEREGAAQ